ncbi:MAG: glycosyltransferase family 2 protein [Actinomycetota bacterium]|nr:glycosyltransferase family 2 protein [Actinomycetota bacterium]
MPAPPPALASGAEWPGVSVLIPTRDRPRLLRETLAAVAAQDYPGPLECVVVFDQSTPDPTLEDRAGLPTRVLPNERTPGLAGARNTGILAAAQPLVAFCDDDDTWLPTKLTEQVRLLDARPDASLVAHGMYLHFGRRVVRRVPDRSELDLTALLRSRVMEAGSCTFLVRRDDLRGRIGLIDERLPASYAEDYDLLLRAARHGPVVVVRKPLARVLWGRTSFFAGRWETIVAALQHLLDEHPEFREEPRGLARIYGQMAFAHAALAHRGEAWRLARRTLSLNWRERRAYVSLLVLSGLMPARTVVNAANVWGRGV